MAEKHVVFALVERRARLAGELRAKQAEVLHLKRALASVDLCISMFKADYQPETILPKITLGKNPAGLPKGAGDFEGDRTSLYRNGIGLLGPGTAGQGTDRAGGRNACQNDPQQLFPAEESCSYLRSIHDMAGEVALATAQRRLDTLRLKERVGSVDALGNRTLGRFVRVDFSEAPLLDQLIQLGNHQVARHFGVLIAVQFSRN
jgi:hypothetical protein